MNNARHFTFENRRRCVPATHRACLSDAESALSADTMLSVLRELLDKQSVSLLGKKTELVLRREK